MAQSCKQRVSSSFKFSKTVGSSGSQRRGQRYRQATGEGGSGGVRCYHQAEEEESKNAAKCSKSHHAGDTANKLVQERLAPGQDAWATRHWSQAIRLQERLTPGEACLLHISETRRARSTRPRGSSETSGRGPDQG